jgi:hypothetical protein
VQKSGAKQAARNRLAIRGSLSAAAQQLPSRTPGSIAARVAAFRAIARNSSRWMYAAFQGSWPKSYQNVSRETIGDITLDMTNPIGG